MSIAKFLFILFLVVFSFFTFLYIIFCALEMWDHRKALKKLEETRVNNEYEKYDRW